MGLSFSKNVELQNLAVQTAAKGGTVKEMADVCGISKNRMYGFMRENAEFKNRINSARMKFLQDTAGELRLRVPEAISTLLGVLQNPKYPATAKVSAAKIFLEYSLTYEDALDYEATFSTLSSDLRSIESATKEPQQHG